MPQKEGWASETTEGTSIVEVEARKPNAAKVGKWCKQWWLSPKQLHLICSSPHLLPPSYCGVALQAITCGTTTPSSASPVCVCVCARAHAVHRLNATGAHHELLKGVVFKAMQSPKKQLPPWHPSLIQQQIYD